MTYNLAPTDQPVLYHRGEPFWFSEALDPHIRLHFYADPLNQLLPSQFPQHMRQAYGAFNHQMFAPPFSLQPNLDPRMTFANPSAQDEIPQGEEVDLCNRPGVEFQALVDGSGNCLPPIITD